MAERNRFRLNDVSGTKLPYLTLMLTNKSLPQNFHDCDKKIYSSRYFD
ncbi:hypothetical protein DSUL_60208 [Desulfovibrionales bacterium]